MSFLPLGDVRVVDFCSNIAGPFGSMILAQLGADVIKVEPPTGDDSRSYAALAGDVSVVHRYVGAGKRGVVVDLKSPEGVEVALAIIASADVVLQSMRPGVAERLGIGRDAAKARNAKILYYDVNAFGKGPAGSRLPGYDPLVQAFSGIMEMTGHDGAPPTRCAPSVVDLGTGQWVAMGVLAALLARANGQEVAAVETALVDSAFSLVAYQATTAALSGERPRRAGSGNPIAAPYQCYQASDGYVLLAAPSQRLWEGAARALGAPELADDDRFRTLADRSRNRDALEAAITAITIQSRVDDWIERLTHERVPAGKVLGLEQAVETKVAQERQTFLESDGVPLVRLPWLADGRPVEWRRPAPRLGEHTVEVLVELGYTRQQVDDLIAGGAIASEHARPSVSSETASSLALTRTSNGALRAQKEKFMSNDELFIIDAVAHPYNFREDNYGDSPYARVAASATAELAWALVGAPLDQQYALPRGAYMSDWSVDDTAAMLFGESTTDVAICHHLPIYAFKDGLVSIEKTAEARERYPNRFIGAYAGVDPLQGKEALRSLERQVEMFDPIGVKMYPTSWSNDTLRNWKMDDPEITYPILEKAGELGIKVAAIHKAIPIGPVPVEDAYGSRDVENAATHFPDMSFEIVHGGLSFVEETAWLMARYPNVWINLEIWGIVALRRPRVFAKLLLDLLNVGGAPILDRLMWGTGTVLHHPRPTIEAFLEFEFPEDLLDDAGLLFPVGQLTMEQKANILGRNYARMHGLDIDALRRGIGTDQFSRKAGDPLPDPYSTISKAAEIREARMASV